MVHLTTDRRCEIVLFGDNVEAPRPVHAAGRVRVHRLACRRRAAEAKVTRIVRVKGELEVKEAEVRRRRLAAVLTTRRRGSGGGYAEAVELVRRADRRRCCGAPA